MTSSTRPDRDETASLAVRGVTRRTVARTAAWATPVLVTAVGAPAFAGTGLCVDRGTAVLACSSSGGGGGHHHHDDKSGSTSGGRDHGDDDDQGDDDDDQGSSQSGDCKVTSLTFGASAITAQVGITATDAKGKTIAQASDTGVVRTTTYTPKWNYLNLHHPQGMKQGDTLTMTITLTQPVRNFTVRITDIDKDPGSWIDEVFASPQGYTATKGSNVTGTGATGDPFIADQDGRIDDGDHPDAGDVTLLWPGAVTQVTIRYVVGDKDNKSSIGQHIGVGQFGFDNCA